MCHMTADTLAELHTMADRLQMKRAWFQIPPKTSFPHYDVEQARRAQAISFGAIEVSERVGVYFAAKLGIEWAQEYGDEELVARYKKSLARAKKHVPPSLIASI